MNDILFIEDDTFKMFKHELTYTPKGSQKKIKQCFFYASKFFEGSNEVKKFLDTDIKRWNSLSHDSRISHGAEKEEFDFFEQQNKIKKENKLVSSHTTDPPDLLQQCRRIPNYVISYACDTCARTEQKQQQLISYIGGKTEKSRSLSIPDSITNETFSRVRDHIRKNPLKMSSSSINGEKYAIYLNSAHIIFHIFDEGQSVCILCTHKPEFTDTDEKIKAWKQNNPVTLPNLSEEKIKKPIVDKITVIH